MKLSEVLVERQLDELMPSIGMSTPPSGTTAPQQPSTQPNQPTSGLAGGQMDPAQAAQAAKDRQEQKKRVQDAIKQKQQELTDLQKELAKLG
jgi:hypothetical protein